MRWDRVVMGATLIAIGVLFLLDRADVLDAGRVIGDRLTGTLVGFGLLTLAVHAFRWAVLTAIRGGVGVLGGDDAPRLRVDALAILGGVEVKHDK